FESNQLPASSFLISAGVLSLKSPLPFVVRAQLRIVATNELAVLGTADIGFSDGRAGLDGPRGNPAGRAPADRRKTPGGLSPASPSWPPRRLQGPSHSPSSPTRQPGR